jgi:Asp-tRNA(Asn)/Glu-tRNA(Gln) amidotransferase A subunit family amidase
MLESTADRRQFLGRVAAFCATGGLLSSAAAQEETADAPKLAEATLASAERLAGVEFSEEERALLRASAEGHLENLKAVRALHLRNSLPPAFRFRPDEGLGTRARASGEQRSATKLYGEPSEKSQEIPFSSIRQLAQRLRKRELKSVDLTRDVLRRLEELNERLSCVISFCPERAMEEAARADAELDAGTQKSVLHGIPYGAKDLLAARGAPTTWGAQPFSQQEIDADADVVRRLQAAGAVLAAKTSVGALAWGDVWFGATTRNPWKLSQGSSGSSAGSASAVGAGALPFALGTETLGSLVSPSTRCGVTAIRPTFGRVSRGGCMALSWTMDKIGPLARSAADCALVLQQIAGAESNDPDSVDRPLHWTDEGELRKLRVGVVRSAFDEDGPQKEIDAAVLKLLQSAGVKLVDVALPEFPVWDLMVILEVEAAAAFEELTLSNRDDELVRQVEQAWPNVFRAAQLVPAVQYVQAQRARTMLMREYADLFEKIDVFACPSFGASSLGATNLTGHPTVVVPNGFREDGTPTSICFTSGLYREGDAVALAHLYQSKSDWHKARPTL